MLFIRWKEVERKATIKQRLTVLVAVYMMSSEVTKPHAIVKAQISSRGAPQRDQPGTWQGSTNSNNLSVSTCTRAKEAKAAPD